MTMTPDQARSLVSKQILFIIPDADLDGLPPDADLRRTLELDSLDFLEFVERLSKDAGVRIDESDYPSLATMESCQSFLVARSAAAG